MVDDFAFMSTLPDEESDEIMIDEEIKVNTIVCSATMDQNDSIHHDTGTSHHIFHKHELFHDYAMFESPLAVHGFGTSLTTQAVRKGKVILKSTYDGLVHNFSVSNVLHIPTAHCNLLSGSRLDRKGVNTQTGKGKITYFNATDVPFATGSIVKDLYKMDVETVKPGEEAQPPLDLIATMMPSIDSLFGPGAETAEIQKQGFTIV